MKTAFLFISLILLQQFVSAQLQGIGKFKIGLATTSIINDIAKEGEIDIKESHDFMDTFSDYTYTSKKTKKIFILQEDKKSGDVADPKFSIVPDVKVYFINYYDISGVPLNKLYLFFYKDTLYKIYCNGESEIANAMRLKYGDGKYSKSEKDVVCRSRIGGEFTEKEESYTTIWESDIKDIKAEYYLSKYFDSKCQKQFLDYFQVSNVKIDAEVREMEKELKEKAKDDEENKKKESLKDF